MSTIAPKRDAAKIAKEILNFQISKRTQTPSSDEHRFEQVLETTITEAHKAAGQEMGVDPESPLGKVDAHADQYEALLTALRLISLGQARPEHREAIGQKDLIELLALNAKDAAEDFKSSLQGKSALTDILNQVANMNQGKPLDDACAGDEARNVDTVNYYDFHNMSVNLRTHIMPLLDELAATMDRERGQARQDGKGK